jgi:translation initiation factor IF-3
MINNRSFNKPDREMPINYRIKAQKVICIDSEGNNLGVLFRDEAIRKAKESGMDLVLIADGQEGVPICKVLDYGKFKYEQTKKRKETDKKQRESLVKTKELKFRPTTDVNDLRTKANKANEFLDDGDKVKVFIIFRGREVVHKDVGMQTLNKFMEMVNGGEFVETPLMQGKVLSVLIQKKKEVKAG